MKHANMWSRTKINGEKDNLRQRRVFTERRMNRSHKFLEDVRRPLIAGHIALHLHYEKCKIIPTHLFSH